MEPFSFTRYNAFLGEINMAEVHLSDIRLRGYSSYSPSITKIGSPVKLRPYHHHRFQTVHHGNLSLFAVRYCVTFSAFVFFYCES